MQPIDCHTAAEWLLAYQQTPEGKDARLVAAIDHVSQCPHCEDRMGYLVRALRADREDRFTCQQCQDQLPGYLHAQESGRAGERQWRPVALHLQTCPHCATQAAELAALVEWAYGEQEDEPPYYPAPNLSFLPHRQIKRSWHWDDVGRLIVSFSDDLLRALSAPAFQPAYAGVRAKAGGAGSIEYQLDQELDELEVKITAEEEQTDPSLRAITVRVGIPGKSWPDLAGTEVTLKRGDTEVETQITDAHGTAVFEGIAAGDLPSLVFEIAPRT